MSIKALAKRALRSAGLFPAVRALDRRFRLDVRAEQSADRALYSQFIKPGELVFDVGVNLGQKTSTFLALGAKVIGVEPNPLCVPTLQFEFGCNPNFILVQKALGPTETTLELHFSGTAATATLRQDWVWASFEEEPTQNVDVAVTTLDALIHQFGVPAFCKIDVEGFEFEVLRGLSQPLRCLSFEYHLQEANRMTACLSYLGELSPIQINILPMTKANFLFPGWIRPDELDVSVLPSSGDCFVRPISSHTG